MTTFHSKHILLDMDGVIADFCGAACQAHGRPDYFVDSFNFYEKWGMSSTEFWRVIDEVPNFWINIKKTPWADELLNFLHSNKYQYTISTSPSLSPNCVTEKIAWLRKYIHPRFNNYMCGTRKYLMANHNHLLIDDKEENYLDFQKYGGKAILFPRAWNSNKHLEGNLEYVFNRIQEFYSNQTL